MPNPWKKARIAGVSRFISGLRSKRAGSSLVVETGFPTSLADLVVKNRDRLKKPSWKKNLSPASDSDSATAVDRPPLNNGAPVSGIGEDSRPPVFEEIRRLVPVPTPASNPGSDITTAAALDRPPPKSGAPLSWIGEDPRPPDFEEIRTLVPVPAGTKSRGYGPGFGFLAAKMLVLVVLVAVGRKKLVAGITISAFALLLLEIVGFRVFESLRPWSDARRSLNSVVGGLEFRGRECISPIREVGIGSLRPDMGWEESTSSDRASEVSLERRDLVAVGKVVHAHADWNTGSSSKSKTKKLLRKFVPKKFHKGKVRKGGKEHDLGSSIKIVSDCNREEEVRMPKEQEEEEQSDEKALSLRVSDEVSHFDTEDVRENVGETKFRSSRQLVFLVVVLLGLTGGRVVAVVVTAAWYLFGKLIELSQRKHKAHRIN